MEEDLLYKIAVSLLSGIGPVKARSLISYIGSCEQIFKEKKTNLQKIPGIGEFLSAKIKPDEVLKKAEQEIKFINDNKINTHFYLDKNYPKKLSQQDDAPIVLYSLGDFDFNLKKYISIVGTRSMTHYGNENCNKLIDDLKTNGFEPVVVSGLAYGVDYCAHVAALKNNLPTVAVLGHGLSTIYPSSHREMAKKILKNNGALLTEFPFKSKIDPSNFVKRNRIVAGLSEAVIVVESAKKGGSLITAEYAVQYARDVYTFPGRVGDKTSEGCNFLLKTNRAGLIENADDLIYNLRWEKSKQKNVQTVIFNDLSSDEQKIIDLLQLKDTLNVDVISYEINMPINKVLSTLFNLEFKGAVKALPGRMYSLIK